jgi:ATP-dependent helicase HrpA
VNDDFESLSARLDALMVRDRHRLGRALARARAGHAKTDRPQLAELAHSIDEAEKRRAARVAAVPAVHYPEELPISARREEIRAAIANHQVVIVAGETGSGKTTQIPKICLELGRGVDGMIGHTQPRRIAAVTVAERIAEELSVPLGSTVGYAIRFTDTVKDTTLVKVMTDGILLAEIRRDRLLTAYDTIIVDEAHERSLNIDFLLGYLTRLLPQRPDLKVIVTSATIDTERFAAHFQAPIIEVSGRTFPVEVRYRPIQEDDREADLNQAICSAVGELTASGPGDVLVFLPGERDIRDAADALAASGLDGIEVLPLYARLTAAEQHRVFRPHRGRRVVLATNVAETSLTVPGIRSVVDSGLARISRFSHRTKVQRLPIEAISKASANQRAGRCGRVAPGTCIRLYSEEDYDARPDFTDPEILRTNLASVILQMAASGLGEVEAFPFLERPDSRSVADGRALLAELGAFEQRKGLRVLTPIGRRLAQLPIDPRLGRMVLAAEERNCLREVTIIAAALAVQDPRERPPEKAQEADELHRRFVVTDSDFLSFVQLWEYLAEIQSELSGNQFRKRCRAEYLNVLRVREWQDVAGQIRQTLRAAGAKTNAEAAKPELVHQALLAGLLSQIGSRDRTRGDYQGARNARWQIGRGSALARRQPAWVMAGALVETERTWARTVARIEPAWAERIGGHLVRRSYSEPWWDLRRGEAMAHERVTLYGLPIVTGRPVSLARIDAIRSRELFIRHALIEDEWTSDHGFLARNRARVERVRNLEARVRRSHLFVGDEALYDFYDAQLPAEVTNGRRFEQWWKRTREANPDALDIGFGALLDPYARDIDLAAYPRRWRDGELDLPLRYRWAPGAEDDGVTVTIPLALLSHIDEAPFTWNIAGFRSEIIAALLRGLPKAVRRLLVPSADAVREVVATTGPENGSLFPAAARAFARLSGLPVASETWALEAIPAHLRLRFEIVDGRGRVLTASRNPDAIRRMLREEIRASIARIAPELEIHGATKWTFGDLPRRVERDGIVGYPALVDEGASVGVKVLDSPEGQADALAAGTRRLLRLVAPLPAGHLQRRLSNEAKLALARSETTLAALVDDCADTVIDDIVSARGGPAFDAVGFEELATTTRRELPDRTARLVRAAADVLVAAESTRRDIAELEARDRSGAAGLAVEDVRRQVDALVARGFVAAGEDHLADFPRYLEAARRRIERLPGDLRRDAERQAVIGRLTAQYSLLIREDGGAAPRRGTAADAVFSMIEELRVSLWAQSLGTPYPVSEERIARLINELRPDVKPAHHR